MVLLKCTMFRGYFLCAVAVNRYSLSVSRYSWERDLGVCSNYKTGSATGKLLYFKKIGVKKTISLVRYLVSTPHTNPTPAINN